MPARLWEAALSSTVGPRLWDDAQACPLLERVIQRHIASGMIRLHGLLYACGDVRSLGETLGPAHPVRVAFNPDDLGHIRVHDPIEGRDIVTPALAQDYACGLSVHKHTIIHRAAAAAAEGAVGVAALERTRCAIRDATAFALTRHGDI